jgi:hypothetical protein
MGINKPRAAIFDFDGTLCSIDNRLELAKRKEWDAFYNETENSKPIMPILKIADSLGNDGFSIIVISSRPTNHLRSAILWTQEYSLCVDAWMLRQAEDMRPSDEVKQELFDLAKSRYDLAMAFDDRDKDVAMYRRNGILTLQVNAGMY